MKKSILIIGSIVVIAAVVSPYFCGNSVEEKFDQKVVELQAVLKPNPKITFNKTEYSKGWFSSFAKTQLTVNGKPLVMDHKIIHGPWGYFGLGKIETTIEFVDKNLKANIDKLFAGKAPLTLTTKMGFSGYDAIEIYSPAIAKQSIPDSPDVTITWSGMTGKIKLVGDRAITNFEIPELVLENENGQQSFFMKNARLVGEGIYSFDNLPNVISKNWTGNSTITIDKLGTKRINDETSLALNLDVQTKDTDNGTVGYGVNVKLTDFVLPKEQPIIGNKTNNIEFGIDFSGIPKKQLAEFLAYLEKYQKANIAPSEKKFIVIGQDLATELLKGTPTLKIFTQLENDKGKAGIAAEAKLITADTTNNLQSLISNAIKRLEITISPSFSETLLDEAIASGQIPQTKEQVIEAITKNNRFVLTNGQYVAKFEYKQGHLYSNGQQDDELQDLLLMLRSSGLLNF